ncbi:hypothetical protein B0H63DRAFT_505707 [Podospora didyma]|uniref:Uncharacterized protein n=1 Tax=Podospora didyma TaxID=330526 RepID=A0AAE0P5X8_9PEZI|nr:hypothetical protein B0H63DRAFT_505707 [Podospora didyma]
MLAFVHSTMHLTFGLLIGATIGNAQPENSWYWVTTVLTEPVWTICGVVETATVFEQGPIVTSISLPDATLTGITVQPASFPTSCYSLPTPPSSLELIAFAIEQVSSNSSADPETAFFYVGDDGTTPEYVGTVIDGNQCLLDISANASAAGHVALFMAGGESIVFYETGMHHYGAGCDVVSSVVIASFLDQVVSIAETPPCPSESTTMAVPSRQRRELSHHQTREFSQTNFTIQVKVDADINAVLREPQFAYGPSPCTFLSRDTKGEWTSLTWTCQYPGANSSETACEDSFHGWLRPMSDAGSGAQGQSKRGIGDDLRVFLPGFVNKVGSSLSTLIPGLSPALQRGLGWMNTAKEAVLDVAEFGADSLCKVLHMFDEYPILFLDPGLSSAHTIGVYESPPVPTLIETLASHTTPITKEPPRQVLPSVTDFPSITEGTFALPTFSVPTGLVGGLGSIIGGSAAPLPARLASGATGSPSFSSLSESPDLALLIAGIVAPLETKVIQAGAILAEETKSSI